MFERLQQANQPTRGDVAGSAVAVEETDASAIAGKSSHGIGGINAVDGIYFDIGLGPLGGPKAPVDAASRYGEGHCPMRFEVFGGVRRAMFSQMGVVRLSERAWRGHGIAARRE